MVYVEMLHCVQHDNESHREIAEQANLILNEVKYLIEEPVSGSRADERFNAQSASARFLL